MATVVADLTEEERYLVAILQDQSGIDIAEFAWVDATAPDFVFRCWDFQYPWYRTRAKMQIDQCGRAIGKSMGMQMRAFAFPFTNADEEMLVTAPEMIHLDPVTKNIEDRITSCRLGREFLKTGAGKSGFTHRPFTAEFRNGARIVGRIPQKDGRGVKGQHPKKLEMDEAQDYPEPGWVELGETLKYGDEDSSWRAHGVSRGVRDKYYEYTDPKSGWHVHRYTGMHRPDWTAEEREAKSELYGSFDHPDYRRNILGLHGDAQSVLFVLNRLMRCVDSKKDSHYNNEEYYSVRINDDGLRASGVPITELLEFPAIHANYERVWVGMDVGMTNHPSEIIVLGEHEPPSGAKKSRRRDDYDGYQEDEGLPKMVLKTLARVHLERISSPDQRAVMGAIADFYRPLGFGMDRTGLGLPIWSEISQSDDVVLKRAMRAYNFSEKITIGYEPRDDDYYDPDEPYGKPITANVLEYSSDMLRSVVDQRGLLLPWEKDLISEFQGQTYVVTKSSTDAYGKKKFNLGKFHALDAYRMATLCHMQEQIDMLKELTAVDTAPVLDGFLT